MPLERRRFPRFAPAALAAPAAMGRAALGADPVMVVGIHDTSGGLGTYGQPMAAYLDYAASGLNNASGLLGRPMRLVNYDPQSNIQLHTRFATHAGPGCGCAHRPRIVQAVAGRIRGLRVALGLSALLEEQNLDSIRALPDRVLLIRRGRIVREPPTAGLADPALEHEFIG